MLYHINNLNCAYNKGKTVLSVPELKIRPGQILVVLGRSGFGKSTFLETLALMNNTIKEGEVVFSPPSLDGQVSYSLEKLWGLPGKDNLAGIRASHFSFIFQQTNLMPNFTVFENIYIARMIQGFPEEDCFKETTFLLNRLGLSDIEAGRRVTELSGGQRQRVAFARAIISPFDVLFGDEPTGNLDEGNANDLLTMLVEFIRQQNSGRLKTAIIVTHSVDMAIAYADTIVVIQKANGAGLIRPDAIFQKKLKGGKTTWSNDSDTFSDMSFNTHIRTLFTETNEHQ